MKTYILEVAYANRGVDTELDVKLRESVGRKRLCDSGYGFGGRGLSWRFKSTSAAISAFEKLCWRSELSSVVLRMEMEEL